MVAYKNNSNRSKDYKTQEYQLTASTSGMQYNPSYNKRISADTIDGVVLPSEIKELYQKRIEPSSRMSNYDLLQPIWFEEILKKLANNNAKKSEKEKPQKSLYYVNLN